MSSRRAITGIALGAVMVALLASCTPPSEYGVRLNADETIDFVLCTGFYGDGDLVVDYRRDDDDIEDPEWVIASDVNHRFNRKVVEYGSPPTMTTTVRLEDPPKDWVSVSFGGQFERRSELVTGEWLWSTDPYPWVPDQPCIRVTPLPERP